VPDADRQKYRQTNRQTISRGYAKELANRQTGSDVNKDWTPKDQDQTYKDQYKDKDQTLKDEDKDKDQGQIFKDKDNDWPHLISKD